MTLQTPVLLLVFNRPSHTAKILESIREVKPRLLFVAADGPRENRPEDKEKCKEVRDLIKTGVDWDCELKTLFREENLGCGHGPADAITWFFNQVEDGIILEDDCLPSISFFDFCSLMLKKYRTDRQIIAISGFNFFGEWNSEKYDYFFSDGGNWGWATWRRGWNLFDYQMSAWKTMEVEKQNRVLDFYPDFQKIYDLITVNDYDAWDIQWHFARLITDGLTVTPSRNLVRNIGFDSNATHTFDSGNPLAAIASFEINIAHDIRPSDKKIDLEYRRKILEQSQPSSRNNLIRNVKHILRRIVSFFNTHSKQNAVTNKKNSG